MAGWGEGSGSWDTNSVNGFVESVDVDIEIRENVFFLLKFEKTSGKMPFESSRASMITCQITKFFLSLGIFGKNL